MVSLSRNFEGKQLERLDAAKQSTQSTTHKAGEFTVAAAAFDCNDDGFASCDSDNAGTVLFVLADTGQWLLQRGFQNQHIQTVKPHRPTNLDLPKFKSTAFVPGSF